MAFPSLEALREPPGRRSLSASTATFWGIVRHELLFLCFASMEIALVTPVVLVILGWARYWPSHLVAAWLILIMLLPLNLIRLMSLLDYEIKRQRWLLIWSLLLTIFMSWRLLLYTPSSLFDFAWLRMFAGSLGESGNLLWTRDLSIFLITALMWWRGIRLAIRHPEINNVGLRLRLGGLIFLPLILWFGGGLLSDRAVPFVLLFFTATLVAVSLVRAENIEQQRSGTAATLNVHWFLVVAGAALVVVIGSGMIGAILSGDSLFTAIGWLNPLWEALRFGSVVALNVLITLFNPVLEGFAIFVQFLAGVLTGLMNFLSRGMGVTEIFQQPTTPEIPELTPEADAGGLLMDGKATTVVLMLGLVGLIALALARVFRQAVFMARESDRSQTLNEDVTTPGLGRRLLERLGIFRQWRAATSIRRVYRSMCQSAASAGYPRLDTETPYEYLPALAKAWPDFPVESHLITEAFVRIRYGEFPETAEELESIREAWRRMESARPHRSDEIVESGPTLEKRS